MTLYEFKGTWRQIGQQYGEACRDGIRAMTSFWKDRVFAPAIPHVSLDELMETATQFVEPIKTCAPEYMEELELLNQPIGLYKAVEWLFLIAGGMTVAYMVKLFVLLFVEKNRDREVQARYDSLNGHYASFLWVAVLCGSSLLAFVLGVLPHLTQDRFAALAQDYFCEEGTLSVHYFALGNLKGALISLSIGAFLYWFFVREVVLTNKGYRNPWPADWDLEKAVYVPLLTRLLPFLGAVCARFAASLFEWAVALCNKVLFFRYDKHVHPEEDNYFARYKSDDPGVRGFRAQIAYALALFSAGFVCIMVYLLVRNFVG
jgi:hydrogenase-4 component B